MARLSNQFFSFGSFREFGLCLLFQGVGMKSRVEGLGKVLCQNSAKGQKRLSLISYSLQKMQKQSNLMNLLAFTTIYIQSQIPTFIDHIADTLPSSTIHLMSKTHQQLLFTIDNGDQPCDTRLSNIANPKSSKKWLMNAPQDFFIFSLKFQVPSTVYFVEMKGLNTYKLDLTFKDHNRKFLCEKNFIFETQDELKLVEIWQHPYCTYVDVKLLNNRYTPMRMGLNYIAFKGKYDSLLVPEPNPIIRPKPMKHSEIFKDRQTGKQRSEVVVAIDDVADKNKDIYFEEEDEQKRNNAVNTLVMDPATLGPTQPIPQPNQQIVIDAQTLPEHQHGENVFPLTYEQLETEIIEPSSLKKGYVTYAYDESKQWWNILKFVRKEWVQGQRNIENQKHIAVEDRMSDKIQVKHLFRKKIMAEGLDPQRRNIIQQTAVLMGATLKTQVEPGCLVVTTRQYGEKLRKMKKFKVAKIVTEEYIFNCKRFNALLNEEDYIIR